MRIQGITIPDEKRIEIALTEVYGVGRARAHKILDEAKVDYGTKTKALSSDEESAIRKLVEAFKIEGDLKRQTSANIKRLKDISSFRGNRHTNGLPQSGRTKTNSRTRRGNKRSTMGSGRRKVDKK